MEYDYRHYQNKNSFISKVYKTLLMQLLTMVIIVGLTMIPSLELMMFDILTTSSIPVIFTTFISQFILISFAESLTDNWVTILLFIFNISTSFIAASATLFVSNTTVIMALITTTMIVALLNYHATFTQYDYSQYHSYMVSMLWSLIINSVLSYYFGLTINSTLYAFTSALLFSAFILVDTQKLVNSPNINRRNGHIISAMSLYIDIVNLFIDILKILSVINDSKRKKRKD